MDTATIEIGSVVTRKRDGGRGIVTHLYNECSHKFRGHPGGRRDRCDYKPRPYATIRWSAGTRFNGTPRETVTVMPLARLALAQA